MLSPAKAITAGALVFAIGGALLMAQPFDQQTSLPAAETADERMAPAEFTGTWDFSGLLIPASNEHVGGGLVEARGGAWHHGTRDITDPRFDGDVSIFPNSDSYVGPDTGQLKVWNEAWRVENDEGTWQGEPTVAIDFPDGETAPRTSVFYGEGAYEGLVAVVELTPNGSGWDLRGVIFDGALPPDPEPRPIE